MKRSWILGAFFYSGFLLASPVHNIVTFGDSLSDTGKLFEHRKHTFPPTSTYFEGRFSNGPVWVEYLGKIYFSNPKAHLQNYAFGGAVVSEAPFGDNTSFTLDGQVKEFIKDHPDPADKTRPNPADLEDSLFIFWIGSNNYLGITEDQEDKLPKVEEINDELARNIDLLAASGAKHILIINLPDIGKTPFATFLDQSCEKENKHCNSALLTKFSNQHNEDLENRIMPNLKAKYTDVNWVYFNIDHFFNEVMGHTGEYILKNVSKPCFRPDDKSGPHQQSYLSNLNLAAQMKPRRPKDTCDESLFCDLLHPTTVAHRMIAEKISAIIHASGISIEE